MAAPDRTCVWLITGTTSGFGRRIVHSALARGNKVIATARSLDRLQDLRATHGNSDRLHLLQLDVTSGTAAVKQTVDAAAAHWGRIDVLVNNAGMALLGLLEEGGQVHDFLLVLPENQVRTVDLSSTERLRLQFKTNVFGLMDVTNAVLPHMRAHKSGNIVNIGSRSAWRTELPGIGPYGASKAAVHALTETLAKELAQFRIRVLLVAPGGFRTEGIYNQYFFQDSPISDYDALRSGCITAYKSIAGSQKGDPDKAMEALVDVVRGEGVAAGRQWPGYLVLGEDAESDIRTKTGMIVEVLNSWSDVGRGVSFD